MPRTRIALLSNPKSTGMSRSCRGFAPFGRTSDISTMRWRKRIRSGLPWKRSPGPPKMLVITRRRHSPGGADELYTAGTLVRIRHRSRSCRAQDQPHRAGPRIAGRSGVALEKCGDRAKDLSCTSRSRADRVALRRRRANAGHRHVSGWRRLAIRCSTAARKLSVGLPTGSARFDRLGRARPAVLRFKASSCRPTRARWRCRGATARVFQAVSRCLR